MRWSELKVFHKGKIHTFELQRPYAYNPKKKVPAPDIKYDVVTINKKNFFRLVKDKEVIFAKLD